MSAFPYGAARLKTYMEDFFRLTNKVKVRVRCVDVLYAVSTTVCLAYLNRTLLCTVKVEVKRTK